MPLLNQIGRSLSIFMGITAPKREQERLFGILILITTLLMAAGGVVLFLVTVKMVLR